jgi:hypothetical protein
MASSCRNNICFRLVLAYFFKSHIYTSLVVHQLGVHLLGVHLLGVHLLGVHLLGVHLLGVHLLVAHPSHSHCVEDVVPFPHLQGLQRLQVVSSAVHVQACEEHPRQGFAPNSINESTLCSCSCTKYKDLIANTI